jgi:hypothetical protein
MRNFGRALQTTDDTVVLCVCTESCITKATDKQQKYVVLTAFPRQKPFRVHRLTVCTYFASLVWTLKPSVQWVNLTLFPHSTYNRYSKIQLKQILIIWTLKYCHYFVM